MQLTHSFMHLPARVYPLDLCLRDLEAKGQHVVDTLDHQSAAEVYLDDDDGGRDALIWAKPRVKGFLKKDQQMAFIAGPLLQRSPQPFSLHVLTSSTCGGTFLCWTPSDGPQIREQRTSRHGMRVRAEEGRGGAFRLVRNQFHIMSGRLSWNH